MAPQAKFCGLETPKVPISLIFKMKRASSLLLSQTHIVMLPHMLPVPLASDPPVSPWFTGCGFDPQTFVTNSTTPQNRRFPHCSKLSGKQW